MYLFMTIAWLEGWPPAALVAAAAGLCIALVMIFLMTYVMWRTIQDGHARMTPRQAVLYNFIPGFNLYWLFQCIWGFSKDANAYIKRNRIQVKRLPERVFFWYVVLWLISAVPYLGLVTVPICIILVTVIISTTWDVLEAIDRS